VPRRVEIAVLTGGATAPTPEEETVDNNQTTARTEEGTKAADTDSGTGRRQFRIGGSVNLFTEGRLPRLPRPSPGAVAWVASAVSVLAGMHSLSR
jgi:hypothetical protein